MTSVATRSPLSSFGRPDGLDGPGGSTARTACTPTYAARTPHAARRLLSTYWMPRPGGANEPDGRTATRRPCGKVCPHQAARAVRPTTHAITQTSDCTPRPLVRAFRSDPFGSQSPRAGRWTVDGDGAGPSGTPTSAPVALHSLSDKGDWRQTLAYSIHIRPVLSELRNGCRVTRSLLNEITEF